jgi:hypothetical protein
MPSSQNLERLETIARGLGDRLQEVAFVGGAVVELYVNDPAAPPVRSTADVDCVIPARTRQQMQNWESSLRLRGFRNDTEQGAPICRWIYNDTLVDVMPVDEEALGFTNPWYESALQHTIPYRLPSGTTIRILDLPWYVATKMAAIRGRGGEDFRFSHDFEDVIYLWDAIPDFTERILQSCEEMRNWLCSELRRWKLRPNLREEVECVVEEASASRVDRILAGMTRISNARE